MKKLILLPIFLISFTFSFAQLKGSGRTITKTYDYQNFDKVFLNDLDGEIVVEVGKPYEIAIIIDDNLLPLLNVENNSSNNSISINLKGNENNKMYIEDTNIKIKITLPNLVAITNNTNGSLLVTGIKGNYLKVSTLDNGNTTLIGTINNLETKNNGNGSLNAKQLIAKNAKIIASGNGNVYTNVTEKIVAKTSGNCTVVNLGKAVFNAESSSNGNSKFVNK